MSKPLNMLDSSAWWIEIKLSISPFRLTKWLYRCLIDVIDHIMPLWNGRNPRVTFRICGLDSRPFPNDTASFTTLVSIHTLNKFMIKITLYYNITNNISLILRTSQLINIPLIVVSMWSRICTCSSRLEWPKPFVSLLPVSTSLLSLFSIELEDMTSTNSLHKNILLKYDAIYFFHSFFCGFFKFLNVY